MVHGLAAPGACRSHVAYRVVNDVNLTHSLFEFLACVIDKFVRAQASDEFLISTGDVYAKTLSA